MNSIHQPASVFGKIVKTNFRKYLEIVKSILNMADEFKNIVLYDYSELLICPLYLLDDIEDESKIREGKPCSYRIFGTTSACHSAFYYCFKSIHFLNKKFSALNVSEDKIEKINQILVQQALNATMGQGKEIYWRCAQICPTIDEYLDMCEGKAAFLFYLHFNIDQTLAPENFQPNIFKFGRSLAFYIQILNDYKNLFASEFYSNHKGIGDDLTEGKYSFPIIHAINKEIESGCKEIFLQKILKMNTTDNDLKLKAIERMKELGSDVYTKQYLEDLKIEVVKYCKELFDMDVTEILQSLDQFTGA